MSGFGLKVQLAAAGLGVAMLSGGCGLMAPKAERYIAPSAGTSYVLGRRDTGSYGSANAQVPIKVGRRMWEGSQMTTFEGRALTLLAHPNGNWGGLYAGDKPVTTWEPSIGWDWPLEVGKTWSKAYQVTNHAAKRTTPFIFAGKVESYEDVTVPAGKFKVFKISTTTTQGDENLSWFSPELGISVKVSNRRTAKHPAGAGTREDELISYKRP